MEHGRLLLNTTYSAATQSANGLMSAADKKKLDGVAAGANVTPSGLSSGYVRTGQKSGTTIGDYSTAEGFDTTASGTYSHSEGFRTYTTEVETHAEGGGTTTSGSCAHAEGIDTAASGNYSHASGNVLHHVHRPQSEILKRGNIFPSSLKITFVLLL